MELFGYYYNPSTDTHDVKSFNTPFKVICNSSATKDLIEEFVTVIDNKADEFAEKDSGWILLNFIHLEININKFNPLRASSFIELPPEIVRRQAVVNIRNNDDYCFAWSIVAALHTPTGVDFVTSLYPHYSTVLNTAEQDALNLYHTFLKTPKKMNTLTELEQTTDNNAKNCHICDKPLLGDKVADNCHKTGSYRGPAHSLCNINYKIPNFIPVIMHNLRTI
ncbi:uncharacterized protein LOC115875339 [Sitophilus oryzae]|uniref:Uncharacterized protein LOC115875339 n=1 Tax=Sitophilus oryzae TaxID=7048 RepID=A0A6J2X618_SITOR|nr:uncharacterized protein LOC115875339 [Sitophilus oryzae]